MLDNNQPSVPRRDPWNKGRLIGQKRPLKPKDVWSIRVRLQVQRRARNLALFNLAIDSKLRDCDLVRLQVDDVSVSGRVRDRANIVQKKTVFKGYWLETVAVVPSNLVKLTVNGSLYVFALSPRKLSATASPSSKAVSLSLRQWMPAWIP
jgi:hypothetical protein